MWYDTGFLVRSIKIINFPQRYFKSVLLQRSRLTYCRLPPWMSTEITGLSIQKTVLAFVWDNIKIISRKTARRFPLKKKTGFILQLVLKTRSWNFVSLTAYNGITKPESITIYMTAIFTRLAASYTPSSKRNKN